MKMKKTEKWSCESCYKTIYYPPILVESDYAADMMLCKDCAGVGLFKPRTHDDFRKMLARRFFGE